MSDYATEPQAISKWLDGKASDGETQMGHGIQRLPGVRRWLHEHAGEQLFGISYNVKTISVLNLSPHLISLIINNNNSIYLYMIKSYSRADVVVCG